MLEEPSYDDTSRIKKLQARVRVGQWYNSFTALVAMIFMKLNSLVWIIGKIMFIWEDKNGELFSHIFSLINTSTQW